jgi:hypothetical protein
MMKAEQVSKTVDSNLGLRANEEFNTLILQWKDLLFHKNQMHCQSDRSSFSQANT